MIKFQASIISWFNIDQLSYDARPNHVQPALLYLLGESWVTIIYQKLCEDAWPHVWSFINTQSVHMGQSVTLIFLICASTRQLFIGLSDQIGI